MSKKLKIGIFQFHGCDKCFNETLLLNDFKSYEITQIPDPKSWAEEPLHAAVITGYLLPEDETVMAIIQKHTDKVVGFGSCTVTGGVFGLAYQKGTPIQPLEKILDSHNPIPINGCLGEIAELKTSLEAQDTPKPLALCKKCSRKSTCSYLDEVQRQLDPSEDTESCFNDLGFMCTGYIAQECKEMCVNYGAPCRGCKPIIDRPGFRMLGMFGTLMANVEVATEQNKYGATDKLADEDDDVTESVLDVSGKFFRFNLANSVMPIGKQPSTGTITNDLFIGRLIEELPMITGVMGGNHFISLTLDAIEAYEKGANTTEDFTISKKTMEFRQSLLDYETKLHAAVATKEAATYKKLTSEIRKIAGNMNLSNLTFGGFRTPIDGSEEFDAYKLQIFEPRAGDYASENGRMKYSLDEKGIITKFEMEA